MSAAHRILSILILTLIGGTLCRHASGQGYPYFAPGGALSCSGGCTQQTVDLTQSGFVIGPLATAKTTGCVINAQTGTTYTLVLSDANNCVTMNNAAANTLTLPLNASVAFPIGAQITIQQTGAGQTTITPTGGVTLNFTPGNEVLTTGSQWGVVRLRQTATDVWSVDAINSATEPMVLTAYEPQQGGAGHCAGGSVAWSCATAVPNIAPYPLAGSSAAAKDLVLAAGGGASQGGTSLKGNGYASTFWLGASGDAGYASGIGNPVFWFAMLDNTALQRGSIFRMTNSALNAANSLSWGISTQAATGCPSNIEGSVVIPAIGSNTCAWFEARTGGVGTAYPLVFICNNGLSTNIACDLMTQDLRKMAIGDTIPVYWLQATSTGTSQASVTIGDTNSASTTTIVGGGGITVGSTALTHENFAGTAPAVSTCGTSPSIDAHATDASGTVTVGSVAAASCTVTFAVAFTTWNHCRITSQSTIASFAYSYSLSAITVTGTSLVGDKFDYDCDGS